MGKIPIVVCYDGRWDESNRYVDNRIKGVLVSECDSFSSLLELLYTELYLDFHKHHANLFVNMQLDSSENSVVELKSDGAVAWFLSIAKDDKQMKFPLVVHVEALPMHDLIEKSAISSNDVFGSDVMGIRVNFEHSSSFDNTNKASSSTPSCITSKSGSNTSMLEFVEASKVDDLKENYLFSGKEEIKKALHLIATRKNFEFKTMKSDERRLIVQCIGVGCGWFMRASRYKEGDLWLVRKYINKHTCSLDLVVGDHKQATSAMISELIPQLEGRNRRS